MDENPGRHEQVLNVQTAHKSNLNFSKYLIKWKSHLKFGSEDLFKRQNLSPLVTTRPLALLATVAMILLC